MYGVPRIFVGVRTRLAGTYRVIRRGSPSPRNTPPARRPAALPGADTSRAQVPETSWAARHGHRARGRAGRLPERARRAALPLRPRASRERLRKALPVQKLLPARTVQGVRV